MWIFSLYATRKMCTASVHVSLHTSVFSETILFCFPLFFFLFLVRDG